MDMIAIFKGSPTAGSRDGVEVSSGDLMDSPVEAILDRGDSINITLAVRCVNGCSTDEVTLMSNEAWLTLSKTGSANSWTDEIEIQNVGDTNVLFYAKITAGSVVGVHTGSITLQAEVEDGA